MSIKKKKEIESNTENKKTLDLDTLVKLNDKLDKTIERISALENKIEQINPNLQDATGSLNMTLAILRTFQDVTNVATIFSPSKWIMRLRPEINFDSIERAIVDVLTREGPKNISQLTASIKQERGTSSRRIIREKVNDLIKKGILEELGENHGRVIKMAIELKDLQK